MTEEQDNRTVDAKGRYHHFRLPLLRWLIGLTYAAEWMTVQRVWHIRRRLTPLLTGSVPLVRMIDVGCGLGDHLFFYARHYPETQCVGIDHELANILVCRAYRRLLGLTNLTFDYADFVASSGNADADLAICSSVLQYQPDLAAALRSVTRHLKPGGILLVYQDVAEGTASPLSWETCRPLTRNHVLRSIGDAGCRIEYTECCEGVLAQMAQSALRVLLSSTKRHPVGGAVLLIILSITAPLYLLALWLDFLVPHRRGAAVLVLARRTGDVQRPEA